MIYISCYFYLIAIALIAVYYALPLQARWLVLLMGSIAVYFLTYKTGWWIILVTILVSYLAGMLLEKCESNKKVVLLFSIILVLIPWWITKNANYLYSFIVPLGISFYTLQLIAYFMDVYQGKIAAQKNPAKFALFVLFFPQIVQGPIPRYKKLFPQLIEGHEFNEKKFIKGIQLVIWGFFLKLVIADKAAIIVNTLFNEYAHIRGGGYTLVAGILYSIQLYTDFLACVTISQGVAHLFGITLAENFARPYLSTSVNEFWRRWHISLSSWLRDYLYIPLGGSKKGNKRWYINLLTVFAVSGVWHGAGFKFLIWGVLHAFYQIFGKITQRARKRFYEKTQLNEVIGIKKVWQRIVTFLLVMIAWIIFRADSLNQGMQMISSMITVYNPWIFFDGTLLNLGLCWQEWIILLLAICLLAVVETMQEKGIIIGERVLMLPFYIRMVLYIAAILGIMTFGTYGFGFDSQDFIYGGF